MQAWHFSETAYPYLPDESEYESVRVTLPNGVIDPARAADLWHRYLDEWAYADELGIGIMLNEHHSTATCMDPCAPLIAAVLARETKRSDILLLGNPIANRRDPVRVAEEMALVDLLSRGRLICGLVRGVPYEISATNSMPLRMSERFWEAHDLILKAWTTHDGPFNWQGRYFEHRQVNIWPRPYTQPHPRVWITSLTPSSVARVADHGYTVATFLVGRDGARRVFDAYRARRTELGLPTDEGQLAYAALVYVGDTDEEGLAGAQKLMWYIRANKVPPQFNNPPGYSPAAARVAAWRGQLPASAFAHRTFEELLENGVVFAGNPDTVTESLRRFYGDVGGFGHLMIMGQAGHLEHDETIKSMRLYAEEVHPRLQDLVPAVA